MSSYLITHSLIASWNYLYSCYESCEEDAYNDFLSTLNRIPKESTPEMQNGIDFENEVYRFASGAQTTSLPSAMKWEKGIKAVATIIKGAPTQVKASRELFIGSTHIHVYGILDALKAGTIFDVKFSNKSFSSAELPGKYLDSSQHPTYLYLVPEAKKFTYLVSDGEDLYTETHTRANTRPLGEIVKEFLCSLEAMRLMDIYKEKWITG